jgi:hypothetical protein
MSSDIVYLDLNLNSTTDVHPSPLSRQVVRTSSIISNVGDYAMAVARASFPQMSIPMWQPTLALGQFADADGYPTQTEYTITLSYVRGDGSPAINSIAAPLRVLRTLMWIPPPPIDPVRGLVGQPDNGFNDVFDMDTITRMHNNAFAEAFADLSTKITNAGITIPPGTIAPYMTYVEATQLLTVTAYPYSFYQTMITGKPAEVNTQAGIQIWYNAAYVSYLAGWSLRTYNNSTKKSATTQNKDVLLMTGGLQGNYYYADGAANNTPIPSDPTTAYVTFNQEWPGFFVFRALMRIQIIGTGLNSVLEGVDLPLSEIAKGGTDLQSAVICDFDPDTGTAGAFQQPLIYTPGSIIPGARFIDLMPNRDLQSFNIQIEWQDSLGRSRPMYAFSQAQSASIKLVFVKKSYLKHNSGVKL